MRDVSGPWELTSDAATRPTSLAQVSAAVADVERRLASLRLDACELDGCGAAPEGALRWLAEQHLLRAALPVAMGGAGLGQAPGCARLLARLLDVLGQANGSLARLYEGHVNACFLLETLATPDQWVAPARWVCQGGLLAVWGADSARPARARRDGSDLLLRGQKAFCSGAGIAAGALVTARDETDRLLLVLLPPAIAGRANGAAWRGQGMRGTRSGTLDLDGVRLPASAQIGPPDAFLAEPCLNGGAWRFLAVQSGMIAAVVHAACARLRHGGRDDDPVQLTRIARMGDAMMTARDWAARACGAATSADASAEDIVGIVSLARMVVERCALAALEAAEQAVGAAAFLRGDPLELAARDLRIYLRQPHPDGAVQRGGHYVRARVARQSAGAAEW